MKFFIGYFKKWGVSSNDPIQWRRDLSAEQVQLTHITLSLNGFKIIIKPSKSFSSYYSHALAILNNVSDSIPILEKNIFWSSYILFQHMCNLHTYNKMHIFKCAAWWIFTHTCNYIMLTPSWIYKPFMSILNVLL